MHFSDLLNPLELIRAIGVLGVFVIVFIESGMFFGFFFPGDSLLFAAGLLAAGGYLSFPELLIGVIISAILGYMVGYIFGKKIGPRIFKQKDTLFFRQAHLAKATEFYEKHGKKTIVLARFIPIVRTFAPILAGVAGMEYQVFTIYNIVGGILWGSIVVGAGFFLGNSVPNIDSYIIPIILGIILVTTTPVIFKLLHKKIKN